MVKRITSLGLFILDSFQYLPDPNSTSPPSISLPNDRVEIGGGGLYTILGSRIWLPASEVGLLIDRGSDWDFDKIQGKLDVYGDVWIYREKEGETTRALNLYAGNHRDFKYLTPRTRLEPIDLPPSLLTSNWLHFVCSPTRAIAILSQLSSTFSPQLCFEPIPDRCIPEELNSLIEVLPHLAVFSPNHEEALSLLGMKDQYNEVSQSLSEKKSILENVAERFLELGVKGLVVIRSGAMGSFSQRKGMKGCWVEAYHTDSSRVLDPTGAGNSFLGGLMAGLEIDSTKDEIASMKASVSASYFIEQYGIPSISTTQTGVELWNGTSPAERLEEMKKRSSRLV